MFAKSSVELYIIGDSLSMGSKTESTPEDILARLRILAAMFALKLFIPFMPLMLPRLLMLFMLLRWFMLLMLRFIPLWPRFCVMLAVWIC